MPDIGFVPRSRRLGKEERQYILSVLYDLLGDTEGYKQARDIDKRELMFYIKRHKLLGFEHSRRCSLRLATAPYYANRCLVEAFLTLYYKAVFGEAYRTTHLREGYMMRRPKAGSENFQFDLIHTLEIKEEDFERLANGRWY